MDFNEPVKFSEYEGNGKGLIVSEKARKIEIPIEENQIYKCKIQWESRLNVEKEKEECSKQETLRTLQQKKKSLQKQLQVTKKIQLLHEYNDLKDIAQTIFEKIASLKGTTIKEIQDEYIEEETNE